MKGFLKPTIGKIIVAALITILQIYVGINCSTLFGFSEGNYFNACDMSILVLLISLPIIFLGFIFIFVFNVTTTVSYLYLVLFLCVVSFLYVYSIVSILSWKLIDKYRKEDGTLYLYEACKTEVAEWRCIQFPIGVIIGCILLIILMNVIPIFPSIIAGIIAGFLAYKSRHSDSAGFIAGTLGGMVYFLFFHQPSGYLPQFGFFESIIWKTPFFFEASFLYFGILGLIGGALGGFLYTHMSGIKTILVNRNY